MPGPRYRPASGSADRRFLAWLKAADQMELIRCTTDARVPTWRRIAAQRELVRRSISVATPKRGE